MAIKNRQQWLIIAAVVGIALLAGDKFIVPPIAKFFSSRSKEIDHLKKEVEDGKRLLSRSKSLQATWSDMRRNTLPPNPSLTEQQVFKAVDQWTQDSRLSVSSITPVWRRDADEYMTLQCRLEGTGNLDTMTRFLHSLETDPLAVKVELLEIGTKDKDGSQLTLGIQMSFLILTPGAKQP